VATFNLLLGGKVLQFNLILADQKTQNGTKQHITGTERYRTGHHK
jgi:hypothetical protein